ncbi:hypothetical protein GPALN_010199 [Globodera pallida]|uniref:DUF281 domain-containing protein n=1 Tax=Globodera pallida TaxID=36090 RepID=A0A183C8S0_GLOPA|nr:hypothetical protein GPALN_010199 [Globodera pallida]
MTILILFLTILISYSCGTPNDNPIVYEGVNNGCALIKCSNNRKCGIRVGVAKFGNRQFEQFDFPKCVTNQDELNRNTEDDGNAKIVLNGPGCKLIQCADGYQCQVRISISKLGDLPYAQSIGTFPQCVSSNGTFESSSKIIKAGPGCDKLPTACEAGTECVTAVGIAKYGNLPWSHFFSPFCA